METIYKYELGFSDFQMIRLPAEAKILSAQKQRNSLYLWAQCDTRKPVQQRTIVIVGTGNPFPCPSHELKFIDTVQDDMFVWHVFEQIGGGQEGKL